MKSEISGFCLLDGDELENQEQTSEPLIQKKNVLLNLKKSSLKSQGICGVKKISLRRNGESISLLKSTIVQAQVKTSFSSLILLKLLKAN